MGMEDSMRRPPKEPLGYWHSTLTKHPDFVNAIGMVSVENANLEAALADLFAAVLHIREEVGRAVYFAPRAAFLRIEILEAAARSRLRPKRKGDRFYENEPGKAAALKQVTNIIASAKSVVGRRHEVIHDAWGVDDETGQVTRGAHPATPDQMRRETIGTLNALLHDLRSVIMLAKSVSAKMRRAPPTLIDLRLESPDKTQR
jgi:hypothetical protein